MKDEKPRAWEWGGDGKVVNLAPPLICLYVFHFKMVGITTLLPESNHVPCDVISPFGRKCNLKV